MSAVISPRRSEFLQRFEGRNSLMNKEGHLGIIQNTKQPIVKQVLMEPLANEKLDVVHLEKQQVIQPELGIRLRKNTKYRQLEPNQIKSPDLNRSNRQPSHDISLSKNIKFDQAVTTPVQVTKIRPAESAVTSANASVDQTVSTFGFSF